MRLLFCWEMGSGFGHIDRMLVVAQALRARGHEVEFALRDLSRAHRRVMAQGFPAGQAPVWLPRMAQALPLINYGAVLAPAGWLDPQGLAGLVRGWQRWFDLVRPDAVLVDHAPTALLAARVAGLRVLAIGNSFELPPPQAAFPPMAWWRPELAAQAPACDAHLLKPLNATLTLLGAAPWSRLSQLFEGVPRAMLQLPDLTHYEHAGDDLACLGPVYLGDRGEASRWPEGSGTRVFAYLNAEHGGVEALLKALVAHGCRAQIYVKNIRPEQLERLRHPSLRFSAEPLHVDDCLREAELVVSHASLGTVTAAALAGLPQLGLPQHMEQLMIGRRLATQGIGLSCGLERPGEEVGGLLKRLLTEPVFAERARAMATRHAGLQPAQTGERAADWIEACCR